MKQRIDPNTLDSSVYQALRALNNFTSTKVLSPLLHELIKVCASQINGCAYCVDSHTKAALELGENARKLSLVAFWRRAGCFSPEEEIVLDLTEQITEIKDGLSQESYARAVQAFGPEGFVEIMMAVISINGWNRLGVTLEMHAP